VLVAGGYGAGATPLSSAELYNPATGHWSPAIGGPLYLSCVAAQDCRTHSTATMLGDGDVLVTAGLIGSASHANTSSEALLYDPAIATWALTGSMNTPRIYHTASLLQNGQVLVAGGEDFGKHVDTLLASPNCTPMTSATDKEKQPWHHDGSGR
jgi:Galactose oxidase, central domain/Kelch motif